jgi:hypothetical protein
MKRIPPIACLTTAWVFKAVLEVKPFDIKAKHLLKPDPILFRYSPLLACDDPGAQKNQVTAHIRFAHGLRLLLSPVALARPFKQQPDGISDIRDMRKLFIVSQQISGHFSAKYASRVER